MPLRPDKPDWLDANQEGPLTDGQTPTFSYLLIKHHPTKQNGTKNHSKSLEHKKSPPIASFFNSNF